LLLASPAAGRFGAAVEAERVPLPYSTSRPPYGPSQVEAVWENAKNPSGRVFDPYTREELFWDKTQPRNGQWDMGHVPDMRYRDYHSRYMNGSISRDEFLGIHQDPQFYRPQSVYSNRSGRY